MSLLIGANVPRRGNFFSRGLGRLVLWLMGWRLAGTIPDLPKMLLIGAPHTSNRDGVIGLTALMALGIRASTMIKDSAFKGVMGPLLRWFGAIPINRRSPKGVVEQSVDAFNSRPQMLLLIAPEGTRSNATEWKRGFYHIASGAQVSILPAAADYKRKVITFGSPLTPSGNYAADLQKLLEFYRDFGSPHHPERMSKPICDIKGIKWQPVDDKDE
ncbi:MAG: lysophospholipid acyltransferase family protein [Stenotrophobium sp.]